jgi:hypothetical protein
MICSNSRRNDEPADLATYRQSKRVHRKLITGFLRSSTGTMVPVEQNRFPKVFFRFFLCFPLSVRTGDFRTNRPKIALRCFIDNRCELDFHLFLSRLSYNKNTTKSHSLYDAYEQMGPFGGNFASHGPYMAYTKSVQYSGSSVLTPDAGPSKNPKDSDQAT